MPPVDVPGVEQFNIERKILFPVGDRASAPCSTTLRYNLSVRGEYPPRCLACLRSAAGPQVLSESRVFKTAQELAIMRHAAAAASAAHVAVMRVRGCTGGRVMGPG